MKALIKIVLLIAFLGGVGYGTVRFMEKAEAARIAAAPAGGPAKPASAPQALAVDGVVVAARPLDYVVSGVGSLLPLEGVDITSEQSRRLKSIHFEEGQIVRENDVLFELDTEDLRSDLVELEARLELSRLRESRLSQLVATNASSQSEYDTAIADARAIAAQIEGIKTQIAKATVRAPFAGRTGLRQVSQGAWVTPAMRLTTLQDTSQVKIDFKIPERHAPDIRAGQTFRFLPEGSYQWREGTVLAIEPSIEVASRSLIVRGIAGNPDGALFPGGFARVEVPVGRKEGALMLPSEAIVPSPQGNAVYIAKDGKALLRPVELGVREAGDVQVVAGLESGETVIVSNLLRLRPGAAIELVVAGQQPDSTQ